MFSSLLIKEKLHVKNMGNRVSKKKSIVPSLKVTLYIVCMIATLSFVL